MIQVNLGNPDRADDWTDYISTFAHITSKKGGKQLNADQIYPIKFTTFFVRYRPSDSIDSSMRVLYRDQVFTILYVIVSEEAKTDTEIYTEEQQAKGSL
jgi:SPP1 family predicted phage head-tail adaptor